MITERFQALESYFDCIQISGIADAYTAILAKSNPRNDRHFLRREQTLAKGIRGQSKRSDVGKEIKGSLSALTLDAVNGP